MYPSQLNNNNNNHSDSLPPQKKKKLPKQKEIVSLTTRYKNLNIHDKDLLEILDAVDNYSQQSYTLRSGEAPFNRQIYDRFCQEKMGELFTILLAEAERLQDHVSLSGYSFDILYGKLKTYLKDIFTEMQEGLFGYFSHPDSPFTDICKKIVAYLKTNQSPSFRAQSAYEFLIPTLYHLNLPENIDNTPLSSWILSEDKKSLIPVDLMRQLTLDPEKECIDKNAIINPHSEKPLTEKEWHDLVNHNEVNKKYYTVIEQYYTVKQKKLTLFSLLKAFQIQMEEIVPEVHYTQKNFYRVLQKNFSNKSSDFTLTSSDLLVKGQKQNVTKEWSLTEKKYNKTQQIKRVAHEFAKEIQYFQCLLTNSPSPILARLYPLPNSETYKTKYFFLDAISKKILTGDPAEITHAAKQLSCFVWGAPHNSQGADTQLPIQNGSYESICEELDKIYKEMKENYLLHLEGDQKNNSQAHYQKNRLTPKNLKYAVQLQKLRKEQNLPLISLVSQKIHYEVYINVDDNADLTPYKNSFILSETEFFFIDDACQKYEIGLTAFSKLEKAIDKKRKEKNKLAFSGSSSKVVILADELNNFIRNAGGKNYFMGYEENAEEIACALCELINQEALLNFTVNNTYGQTLPAWAIDNNYTQAIEAILIAAKRVNYPLSEIFSATNIVKKEISDGKIEHGHIIQDYSLRALIKKHHPSITTIIQTLSQNGEEALLTERDAEGNTLLWHAIKSHNVDALRCLLKYMPADTLSLLFVEKNAKGKTLLVMALQQEIEMQLPDSLSLILLESKPFIHPTDLLEVLRCAVNCSITPRVLEKILADCAFLDKKVDGFISLISVIFHQAINNKNLAAVKQLLEFAQIKGIAEAVLFDVKFDANKGGNTPLHAAVKQLPYFFGGSDKEETCVSISLAILEVIKEQGWLDKISTIRNSDNETIFHIGAKNEEFILQHALPFINSLGTLNTLSPPNLDSGSQGHFWKGYACNKKSFHDACKKRRVALGGSNSLNNYSFIQDSSDFIIQKDDPGFSFNNNENSQQQQSAIYKQPVINTVPIHNSNAQSNAYVPQVKQTLNNNFFHPSNSSSSIPKQASVNQGLCTIKGVFNNNLPRLEITFGTTQEKDEWIILCHEKAKSLGVDIEKILIPSANNACSAILQPARIKGQVGVYISLSTPNKFAVNCGNCQFRNFILQTLGLYEDKRVEQPRQGLRGDDALYFYSQYFPVNKNTVSSMTVQHNLKSLEIKTNNQGQKAANSMQSPSPSPFFAKNKPMPPTQLKPEQGKNTKKNDKEECRIS